MTEHQTIKTQLKTLSPSKLGPAAEYVRAQYHVVVSNDTTLEEVLRPGYWAHHAGSLKPGALVDVVREDFSLDVTLRVVGVGVGLVKMNVIRKWEDAEVKREQAAAAKAKAAIKPDDEDLGPLPDEYKVVGLASGYTLILTGTGNAIKTNLKTRKAAYEMAKSHAKEAGIPWPEDKAPAKA